MIINIGLSKIDQLKFTINNPKSTSSGLRAHNFNIMNIDVNYSWSSAFMVVSK